MTKKVIISSKDANYNGTEKNYESETTYATLIIHSELGFGQKSTVIPLRKGDIVNVE